MRKNGYTLAEVLICLGVIGVLAAIMLPLANKFKPDGTKAMYVKTYDALVDVTREIASNPVLYPISYEDSTQTINYSKAPLYNLTEVTVGKDSSGNDIKYGGDAAKFCELLSLAIPQPMGAEVSCSASAVDYSDSTSFNSPSFTTTRGMQYVIGTDTDGSTKYQTDIYVDLNGPKNGNNCLYSSDCKKPDRFKFIVSGDGHVIPADPMGQEYLKTRMNWRKFDVKPEGSVVSTLPSEWQTAPEIVVVASPDGGSGDVGGNGSGDGEDDIIDTDQEGSTPTGDMDLYPGVRCVNHETFGACQSSYLEIAEKDLPNKLNWDDAQEACAALGLRVPTLNELYTIHEAVKNGVDEGTTATEYWTSTGSIRGDNLAQNGIVGGSTWRKGVQNKSTARQVRCVK